MAEERDERWVYVALGLIAAGYFVHANWDEIVSRVSARLIMRHISTAGYLIAPLMAVILGIARRRKSEAVRREWDATARAEGVLREERGVQAKVIGGIGSGAFKADIRLTRTAFYVLDTTGRRDPMRLMIHIDSANDLGLFDAVYTADARGGGGSFTVRVIGRATFEIRFASTQSMAWWTDIRRSLGLRADIRPTGHDEHRDGSTVVGDGEQEQG